MLIVSKFGIVRNLFGSLNATAKLRRNSSVFLSIVRYVRYLLTWRWRIWESRERGRPPAKPSLPAGNTRNFSRSGKTQMRTFRCCVRHAPSSPASLLRRTLAKPGSSGEASRLLLMVRLSSYTCRFEARCTMRSQRAEGFP